MADLDNNDPLGPFSVELFGRTYTLHPRIDLEIEEDTVMESLTTQPAKFGFYGVIADEAQNLVDALQVKLQQKESELYARFEVREGKLSEDKSKKMIRGHEEYHEIQEALVDAGLLAAKMRSLVAAFVDRRFCLIALSGKQSQHMYQESGIKVPKNIAVSEYRGVGAFPKKRGQ